MVFACVVYHHIEEAVPPETNDNSERSERGEDEVKCTQKPISRGCVVCCRLVVVQENWDREDVALNHSLSRTTARDGASQSLEQDV